MEPVADHLPRFDGTRLPDEDDEGRLEGVLGVVVAEQATANAPHHRPVPLDQFCQRPFVAPLAEASEQLAVAVRRHGPADVLDHAAYWAGRHGPPSTYHPRPGVDLIRDFPIIRFLSGY